MLEASLTYLRHVVLYSGQAMCGLRHAMSWCVCVDHLTCVLCPLDTQSLMPTISCSLKQVHLP